MVHPTVLDLVEQTAAPPDLARVASAALHAGSTAHDAMLAGQRAWLAGAGFALAATRAAITFATLGLALPLAGCPRFHAGPLPGAPADATFVDVDGVHVRYREAGAGPAVVLIHGYGASSD